MKNIYILSANYKGGYKLHLVFNDGTALTADLKDHLDKPIFKPLKDIDYFKSFKLNSFTVEWDNGADFSPEFLYDLRKQ